MTRVVDDRHGFVLVAVLVLSVAVWALLAGLLTTAYLHYRLAVAADRGAVAAAAAIRAAERLAQEASTVHGRSGSWPGMTTIGDEGRCQLSVSDVVVDAAWWRVAVQAEYEGVIGVREVTVHVP